MIDRRLADIRAEFLAASAMDRRAMRVALLNELRGERERKEAL